MDNNCSKDKTKLIDNTYPGHLLSLGSSGSDVALMQSYLNAIQKGMMPSLKILEVDGLFGSATKKTVMQYQEFSCLRTDGIIGKETWNSIVADYESLPVPSKDEYPGYVLKIGLSGEPVANMQEKLNAVSALYSAVNAQTVDGKFGNNMRLATVRFQKQFGLKADGFIGECTWNKITEVYNDYMLGQNTHVSPVYPGNILNNGSSGDSVRFIQSYMNNIGTYNKYSWHKLNVDGVYGSATKQVVRDFQIKNNLKADGIVGAATWAKMISEFNISI